MVASIHPYYFSWQKRVFDVVISGGLLVTLWPLMIVLAALLLAANGQPVIFKQLRLGKDRKPFTIYKFRTMYVGAEKNQFRYREVNEAPEPMFKLSNDPRFVNFGRFLSRTGVDELPQLINIVKGEMSLVGPRPLPVKEAEALDKIWDFRFQVKPGIFSEWSASEESHRDLKNWRSLEVKTLQEGGLFDEVGIILKTVVRQLRSFTRTIPKK